MPQPQAERREIALDIRDDEWQENGGDIGEGVPSWARLYAPHVTIAGLPMHVEAYAVREDRDGTQAPAVAQLNEYLEPMYAVYDVAFQTATIKGREYVVIAFPHGVLR